MAAAHQPPVPILDHVVILVPHATLLSLPPWLTDAFAVLPGGRHADGATENKLVVLGDGAYLELIAFVPGRDGARRSHRWGRRREGHVVDWANTLVGAGREDDLEAVRRRVADAGGGIRYDDPAPGGRRRPDGVELRWVTSSPRVADRAALGGRAELVGGEAPFWCLDRTARDLRVPYRAGDGAGARHPSGALGLAGVAVWVRDGALFDALRTTYDALQGRPGAESEVPGAARAAGWSLRVPEEEEGGAGGGDGQGVGRRTLTLALVEASHDGSGSAAAAAAAVAAPDVYVELSFFSSTRTEAVSGHLGDEKWLVKFDFQKM